MANTQLGSKAVGSIVKLKVNGTATEFIVVHQGKPSSIYDESCNGTWLLMKDIYENRVWQSGNINKYESSDIHAYLNSTFLNLFENNIRDVIKQVKIPYRKNGGYGGTNQRGANGLSCKVFLLSGYEVGFTTSNSSSFPVDGAKLSYFESGTDTSADNKRIAYLDGSAVGWWHRSPSTDSSNNVKVTDSGGFNAGREASSSYGIRPALVLSSAALVDDSGNVVIPDLTAHKTLVGGTAYTVKCGKCMVNGTVYNILKGRTLIGGTGYDITFAPSYDPVFANNTWEQIIAACHNNEVPDTWKVADQKPMTIGGSNYLIDIIGKNHDDYSDGSGKAPLTFQLHDCYKLKKAMHNTTTNSKGWSRCDMRETDLPIILKQMPTEVQSGIREVNKLTSENYTIVTTADKLFLLSEIEIFGSDENSGKGEGTQYDYYKVGNSKVKNYIDGSEIEWWERSPYNGNKRFYCCVNYKGASISRSANAVSGVPFAFCF
nr:MAG TPA: tail protein [Bacteriophage sp.]